MINLLITSFLTQALCLEVTVKSEIYEYPNALKPKQLGWVYPGEVYTEVDSHRNRSGKLTHYMLNSRPPGWVKQENVLRVSCQSEIDVL